MEKKKLKITLSEPDYSEDLKHYFSSGKIFGDGEPEQQIIDFEKNISGYTKTPSAVAVNSGTSALHLALILLNVDQGDEVICQTFSFIATANVITYQKATPVFVDSEAETWNLCPHHLEVAIQNRLKKGKRIKAILIAHTYGMPAKLNEILEISRRYEIPVVEDCASALGSYYEQTHVGNFGAAAIISFNYNKIITTGGGGILLSKDAAFIEKARYLANQAKDYGSYYTHSAVGYNYKMPSLSAALGNQQFKQLPARVKHRRNLFEKYLNELKDVQGLIYQKESEKAFSNRWLSCFLFNHKAGLSSERVFATLGKEGIECRPLWRPLHQQPVYKDAPYYGECTAEVLFNGGVSFPSGNKVNEEDVAYICSLIKGL